MIFFKCDKFIYHLLIILAAVLFIGYLFFGIYDYPSLPWWKLISSDGDNVYSASVLTIVNGEKMYYVSHPGAMLYQLYGSVFKVAAQFTSKYASLTQFYQAPNTHEAIAILGLATQLCRLLVFPTLIFFVVCLYAVFYRLTTHLLLSFLMLFYVLSSTAFLMYIAAVRIEMLNIALLLIAYIYVLKIINDSSLQVRRLTIYSFLIGLFLGLSVLSKIQVIPVIMIGLPCFCVYLYIRLRDRRLESDNDQRFGFGALTVSIFNCTICPWWGFYRPSYINREFVSSTEIYTGYQLIYGNLQESYVVYPLIVMSLLIVLSFVCYQKDRKDSAFVWRNLSYINYVFNLIIFGMMISVYSIFLPISQSVSHYINNTRHLVYVVMSHLVHSGYVTNKSLQPTVFSYFFDYLKFFDFYRFPFRYFLFLLITGIFYRIFRSGWDQKKIYIHSLIWIFIGFLMTLFSSMRSVDIFHHYYAIYQIVFYSIGIVIWGREELNQFTLRYGRHYRTFIIVFISIMFIYHFSARYYFVKNFQDWYKQAAGSDTASSELQKVGDYIPSIRKMFDDG